MNRILNRFGIIFKLLLEGQGNLVLAKLRRALWSEQRFLGLRRDLEDRSEPPSPVTFVVRPAHPGDLALLDGQPISPEDAEARELRQRWFRDGLPGCYVAVVGEGQVVYMQWLLHLANNDRIRAFFGRSLPQLDADTVMLEGAYTKPQYRRIPIMPAAMARIASIGRQMGARTAIVFIGEENVAMIKGTQWAGFVPDRMRVEKRRFFLRFVSFLPLPNQPSSQLRSALGETAA